jgi:hypothetical protein
MIYIVLRDDRGLRAFAARRHQARYRCNRRQRRGIRARRNGGGTGGKTKGYFQKVAAFHDISLFVVGE